MRELLVGDDGLNTGLKCIDPRLEFTRAIQSDKITGAVAVINKQLVEIIESGNYHPLDTMAEFEYTLAIKTAIKNNDDFSDALMSLINESNFNYIYQYILDSLRDKDLENLLQLQCIVDKYFSKDFIKKNFINRGYDKFDKDGILCVI